MLSYKQIANIINTDLIPNLNGINVTIAEDLSNIVELGTFVADIEDAELLKSPMGNFVLGVAKTVFAGKKYSADDLGQYRDAQEYAGAMQVVMMDADDIEAVDDPINTLVSGNNYFDGTFYGIDTNTKVYNSDKAFQVKHSIAHTMYKTMFMSAENVSSYVSLIEQTVSNKVEKIKHALAKANITMAIDSIYNEIGTPRVYKLVTEYNTEFGYTSADDGFITKANFKAHPEFLRWCSMQISRLKDNMKELNKKYNTGDVDTFTSEDDLRLVLLSEFARACEYVMQSDTYHNEITALPSYYAIPYWQNSSDKLLDNMGTTTEVYLKDGTKRSNIVGIVYNYAMAGITARLDKVTAQYIANGDYTTFFHHFMRRQFLDLRNDAVLLVLE